MPLRVSQARRPADLAALRLLLQDYFDGLRDEIPPDAAVAELAALPGPYAAPSGMLLLAWPASGPPVGCAGLRALEEPGTCELKRLYVTEQGRKRGVGRALVTQAIAQAVALGYRAMVLDTLPTMTAAAALYRSLGFEPAPPYRQDAAPDLLCFRRTLADRP